MKYNGDTSTASDLGVLSIREVLPYSDSEAAFPKVWIQQLGDVHCKSHLIHRVDWIFVPNPVKDFGDLSFDVLPPCHHCRLHVGKFSLPFQATYKRFCCVFFGVHDTSVSMDRRYRSTFGPQHLYKLPKPVLLWVQLLEVDFLLKCSFNGFLTWCPSYLWYMGEISCTLCRASSSILLSDENLHCVWDFSVFLVWSMFSNNPYCSVDSIFVVFGLYSCLGTTPRWLSRCLRKWSLRTLISVSLWYDCKLLEFLISSITAVPRYADALTSDGIVSS